MKKYIQHIIIWLVLAFLYLPILILSFYSFTDSTMIGSVRGFSLHNYVTLFTEPALIRMMFGTLSLAVVVALLSVLLGTTGAVGAYYGRYAKDNRNIQSGPYSECGRCDGLFHMRIYDRPPSYG